MKHLFRIFIAVALLMPVGQVLAKSCATECSPCATECEPNCKTDCNTSCKQNSCGSCPSVYIPRPQNNNYALLRALPFEHRFDMDQFYGGFGLDFEYQRSFKSNDIARCLFGSNTLLFQGTDVADRNANALVADYFGLATDFNGSVSIKPVIQNYNLHFTTYLGFDEWARGLYLRMDLTFANQKRSLQMCGTTACSTATTNSFGTYPADYMATAAVPVPNGTIGEALSGINTWGDVKQAWKFARFSLCDLSRSALAAFDAELGWDFLACEDYHLGAFFRVSAPTGNRPNPEYVFDAIVGNGHRWELGGGLTSHWKFWECGDDQSLTAYFDAYVVTQLKDCELRTFDFKYTNTPAADACAAPRGCLSRYMLLKKLSGDATSGFTYDNAMISAVNYNTRRVEARVPVKGDLALRIVYANCGFNFGFGYELYGQAQEDLSCGLAQICPDTNSYGKKGDANATGNTTNSNADAYSVGTADTSTTVITNADLNINSGKAPRQLINKGFLTLDYVWRDHDWAPYLGLVGQAEGGSRYCDLKQWGIAVRGGISF